MRKALRRAAVLALGALSLFVLMHFRHPIGELCQQPERQLGAMKWGQAWSEPPGLLTCLKRLEP